MGTKIEWCTETWNPVVGCDHVSEGCRNCYAEKMSTRLASMDHSPQYDDVVDDQGRFAGGEVNTAPSQLEKPLRWDKPRRIFTCSMSDLFHPDVPFEYIDQVFGVMALAQEHTFQVLTKRPNKMREYFQSSSIGFCNRSHHVGDTVETFLSMGWGNWENFSFFWPLPNVWLGTSVENQEAADKRIQTLLSCPAEVYFLSCEPLLGPIDLSPWLPLNWGDGPKSYPDDWGEIDWVIVGGESGPNARPMHPAWVRSIRDQCDEAGVPFFMKQICKDGKKIDFEEFPDDLQTREWPQSARETRQSLQEDGDVVARNRQIMRATLNYLDRVEEICDRAGIDLKEALREESG